MDQGKIIRFCLVALPGGILLLGVASVFVTHFVGGKDVETEKAKAKQEQAAEIMRKPVTQEDLEKYVKTLAGDIGERNMSNYKSLRAAAFWIESTIGPSNMGYVVDRQNYEVDGQMVWNVVAELPGSTHANEIVIIGAHYDTVEGSPGANDNGTGVAALLSLANAFSGSNPARTLRFVAFVNEEPPHSHTEFMGSVVYAKYLEKQGVKVVAMVSLDTIGSFSNEPGSQKIPEGLPGETFPSTGSFVALVGNPENESLVEKVEKAYESAGAKVPALAVALPETIEGWGGSDHWSFWRSGYPALMVTDTAPYRYPHYRQPSDTPEQIDFPRFTEVVKGLRAVVESLANP